MNENERKVIIGTIKKCTVLSTIIIITFIIKDNSVANTPQTIEIPVATITPTSEVVTNMVSGAEALKVGNTIHTIEPTELAPTLPPDRFGIAVNTSMPSYTPVPTIKPTIKPKKKPEVINKKLYPSVPLSPRFQRYIDKLCTDYGISTNVAMAVIARESNFNIDCIGDYGNSKGLMQIWESYHVGRMKKVGATDLLNCWDNVHVGIDFLAECYKREGSYNNALRYYNGGGNYRKIQATQRYADWVMNKAQKYKQEREEN